MLKNLKSYSSIIIMLLLAITAFVLARLGILDAEAIIRDARDNVLVAAFVVLGIYALKGFVLVIPQLAICLASAAVLSPALSVAVNALGTALCVTESYIVGKFSKQLTFEGTMEKYPKFKKYFSNARSNDFALVFAIHSLHLSTEVQGVLFGLLRTPYLCYISASMLALLPSLVYFTIPRPSSPVFWIAVACDVLVVTLGLRYTKRGIIDGGKKPDKES